MMDINNLRSMAMFADIMTNGASQATKQVNQLQQAQLALNMAGSIQQNSSQLQAQAVALLLGIGGKIDTMA